MATYALTIGGISQSIKAGTLRITESINSRNTMSFEVISWNGSYRPAAGVKVIYTEDSTRRFGGLLDVPGERGFYPQGMAALVNRVNVIDFNTYADGRVLNQTIPAGTLEDVIDVVMPYLSPYGVSKDPAQVTGPAVPALTLPFKYVREILDQASDLTGYLWEIDYDEVLRMFLPGSVAAPFDVVPASDPTVVIGDIDVETVRTEYANRILLVAGSGLKEVSESFTGDGTTTEFPLVVAVAGYPTLSVNGTVMPVGTYGIHTHLEWTFRTSDNTIVQLAEAPAGTFHSPLTGGDTLSLTYPGQYPFLKIADDVGEQATYQIWEKIITAPDVFDFDAAQALADSQLPRYVASYKRVQYLTRRFIRPGQTQTITVPDRNLSGTFLVTDVETTDTVDHGFIRSVKAIGGTTLPRSWKELYRQWGKSGGASSPSATVITGGPSGTSSGGFGLPFTLGSARSRGQFPNPAAWLPVVDYATYKAPASFGAQVRAQAWAPRNGAVNVTVRLYDETASSVVAAGTAVSGTTPQNVTPFSVGLTLGHVYRLEVVSSVNGEEVRAVGSLESV